MEKRTTVLVADGSEEFCTQLSRELQSCGYQIVGTAADGLSAIEQLKAVSPEVLILDLMLPKADGFTVLRSLSGQPRPKLLLTAPFATEFVTAAAVKRYPYVKDATEQVRLLALDVTEAELLKKKKLNRERMKDML